jgi:hypothetical protein
MKDQYMYDLLEQVTHISSVTFTGGEPTLPSGMKVIERFMEICNDLGIEVGNFYITTNAKVWRKEFPELINRLYDFCVDNELSCVDISNDIYHENDEDDRKYFKYRLEEELLHTYGLADIVAIREEMQMGSHEYIFSEGRGFYVGTRNLGEETILYDDEGTFHVLDGTIYLNCDGQVIAGCNWSYESQAENEKIQLCMSNDDLKHAVLAYTESYY